MGSKMPLSWTLSGQLPNGERTESRLLRSDSQENHELTEKVRKWLEIETYGTTVQVNSKTLEDKKSLLQFWEKNVNATRTFRSLHVFFWK